MRFFFNILFLISFQSNIFAQNLLPDGSFESTTDLVYLNPATDFSFLDHWYTANLYTIDSLYEGTPDLYNFYNRWPQSDPPNFWNNAVGAVEGDFHAGIANHCTFEGYLTPEAVGSSLIQPLETNEFYHIELQVRNKGVSGYQHSPILCVPEGYKEIDILLDPDSVFLVIDGFNKTSYTDASKVITLRSYRMESQTLGEWDKVGTCFQANGGEQFLGITLSSGEFPVIPPCVIYDEHWDVFFVYYFDIDDIKLTKLPTEFNLADTICAGRETEFNIANLIDLPIMQNEIEYHWEDGTVDSVNYISEAGIYHIDAVIDCKSIPVILEISDIKCDPNIYVPNAFSPNGDGTNDQFETFIAVDLPIKEYKLSVYNRWGGQVFSTNDTNTQWDGTFKGENLENGIYIWLLEYIIDDIELGIVSYKESGDIAIFR